MDIYSNYQQNNNCIFNNIYECITKINNILFDIKNDIINNYIDEQHEIGKNYINSIINYWIQIENTVNENINH